MKAKNFVTVVLVVLFAVGIPAGVLAGGTHGADPNSGAVWPNEGNGLNMWDIQGPLDTGAQSESGQELSRSSKTFGDKPEVVDHGVFQYRIGIDNGP